MSTETTTGRLQAWVWNEGSKPKLVFSHDDFYKCQEKITEQLETFEFGKMTVADNSATMLYRAFTDKHRGRMVVAGAEDEDLNEAYQRRLDFCNRRVFTPNELYAMPSMHNEYPDLSIVDKWLMLENIDLNWRTWDKVKTEGRIDLRNLAYVDGISDEWWLIATLWFDKKPVAVLTHDGEESAQRYITDISGFSEMVNYLYTFMPKDENVRITYDPDKPLAQLTEFNDYYNFEEHINVRAKA
jgi:hypothetical protein